VTAAGFQTQARFATLSRQTLLSEDRQCCESWRDAELGVRAVCTVRDRLETRGESGSESPSDTDWRSPGASLLSHSTVFLPHGDTAVSCLTNDTLTSSSSSTDCYDD